MAFLDKLFGRKKEEKQEGAEGLLNEVLHGIIENGAFDLDYKIIADGTEGDLMVEFFGNDEEMLTDREGQLLDAFQLYLKRVVQHRMPDERINVNVDCAGFRKAADEALIELANKLRDIALEKGKSVYFRALPPKDRKVVHQHLAEDGRVKSRSIGDGHFKKIKIYPVKENEQEQSEQL